MAVPVWTFNNLGLIWNAAQFTSDTDLQINGLFGSILKEVEFLFYVNFYSFLHFYGLYA